MKANRSSPLISVIVPVYNTAPYLSRCIDSILNQSIKDLEILICDDQSTDGSDEIAAEYAGRHDFVHFLRMEKKGLAGGARNLGLTHAKGEFIGFVDSDDWIDTMMLQKMSDMIKKTGAQITVCGVLKEYESVYETTYRYEYRIENTLSGNTALEMLVRRNNQDLAISAIVCNKLYCSDFIKKHNFRFPENSFSEDDVFNFLCFLNAEKVAITPNTYYHYYQRRNSVTHNFSRKHVEDFVDAFSSIKNYLVQHGLYGRHRDNYYAFLEKCLLFILGVLSESEPDPETQAKYLQYFLEKSTGILVRNEYISFVGPQRLRRFLTPSLIR